jgi:DNA-binding SARP family transcriptional activator
MTHLTLSLLGPIHMALDGKQVHGFAYAKARALLAYLAVESHREHSREALVGLLWPDLPEDAARSNLRQALSSLRQVLGDGAATPPFLHVTRDSIQFNVASSYSLDVTAFTQHLAACEQHRHRHSGRCAACIEHMEQAVALYQGDFLAGFSLAGSAPFEEWVLLWRERLGHQARAALARLADYHERHGALEPARCVAARLLELDPWREEAHRQMMRLLAAGGQRSAAMAQYERCRRVLLRELGVEPEAATTALYRQLRDGRPASIQQAAQTETVPGMLPVPPAHLIGRERQLAELEALLADPAHRLITVLGPAGVGKSRLALAAAAAQADAFPDGVAWVSILAGGRAEPLAALALAALHVPLREQDSPQKLLLGYLRTREMLLVLDGLQTPDDNGAEWVSELLQRAPQVTFLATSQSRLGLRAEWLLTLEGLGYPNGEAFEAMQGHGAVRLFVQQYSQLQGHGPANDEEWLAVARICRLVEGLPLAIERASAATWNRSIVQTATALAADRNGAVSHLRDTRLQHAAPWHYGTAFSSPDLRVLAHDAVYDGSI